MIIWFAISLIPYNDENKRIFKRLCMEMFWDEFISAEDQERILSTTIPDNIMSILYENIINTKTRTIMRLVDTSTSSLKYICNGKACDEAVINYISDSGIDKLQDLRIDNETTGQIYGIIAVKGNSLNVFKTNNPPKVGGKTGTGQECSIVSNMSTHLDKLYTFGEILEENEEFNLDLVKSKLNGTRKISKPTRACMLSDIVLRYMDLKKIDGKRWFYRQISSVLTHNIASRGSKK